ncbi:MAG: PF20097 family protein [Clostridia bacterium]|nr:PF20097 family protein [Clostridia bacterium]
MNCPCCNKEMEEGVIQGARGVIFTQSEKVFFITRNVFNKKDRTIVGGFVEMSSPAYYCYDCECMVWKKQE